MTGSFSARELSDSTIELDLGLLADSSASFDFAVLLEINQRFKDPEGWNEAPYYFKPLSVSHDTTTKLAIARGIGWGIPLAAPVRIDVPGLGYSAHGEWPIAINSDAKDATSRHPVDPVKLIIEELSRASKQTFVPPDSQASEPAPSIPVAARPVALATPVNPAIESGLPISIPDNFQTKLLLAATTACVVAIAVLSWQVRSAWQDAETLSSTTATTRDELLREQNAHLASKTQLAETRGELDTRRAQVSRLPQTERERDAARSETLAARSELQRERDAHAVTRDRLGAVQQQLDSERALRNSSQTAPPVASAAPAAPILPIPPAAPYQSPPVAQRPALDRAGLSECDTLAANPTDPRRISNGVSFPELRANARAAVDACERAVAANPNELRLRYQWARALQATNDGRAAAIFQELVQAEYPAAFDNAAQLLVNQSKFRDAEALYRRGVNLGDPDSMIGLADLIRAKKATARIFGEDFALYQAAASLGHKGAQNEVEKRKAAGQWLELGMEVVKEILSR
ncbi:hypothetical protein I6F30_33570 [Bradyrhizobium sp. NBAIM20]|uniref:hypothetical protein n=1 Tax=unclassified Bradyrhizobium TaxID=2631580 RepID=UPI001CD36A92|nr:MULTISPECIES: hypothetical protein [unclassified Bradyrhizobium]MCA1416018.1 hypothetical protein [Bradyrhizobium sp. NBAIM20]MCA1466058.1 hypothetical protein [Bradyrhizobium sp. NBAIM18]